MNKIKVGDRVSARAFMGIESLGTVVRVDEDLSFCFILVKFDTWDGGHNGGVVDNLDDCSYWWFFENNLVVVKASE